jgi:hypothetical protein
MTATLQVTQHHDTTKVTDMQRVGRRISSQIGCYHFLLEQLFRARHHLCQHTAPFQFFNKVLSHISFSFVISILRHFDISTSPTALDRNLNLPMDGIAGCA